MNALIFLDSSRPWQIFFQDAASPVMEGIVNLHNELMFFLTFILFFVILILIRVISSFSFNDSFLGKLHVINRVIHGTEIEIIWTLIPSLILIIVALPSFALLYSIDEVIDPAVTIKCVGRQWYWSYEYSDGNPLNNGINFDSYMIPEDELEMGELRLLEVDNRVVVPVTTRLRILVTAADVLHSWAVPSLGIKVDACPGRLNETSAFVLREGVFFGQCSEICGVGHANMPIVVEAINAKNYVSWLSTKV